MIVLAERGFPSDVSVGKKRITVLHVLNFVNKRSRCYLEMGRIYPILSFIFFPLGIFPFIH